ncbi:tetratricopeptide repeat protein [Allorhizocola rhizosphaerae]|uniref:tetratricopeptide repeat protein n=1 Tax=Allorhizocola rhizosphaerae TaxID=1872709 RepID=UPI000E3E7AA5|nr:hypothetical protein [Allorhizocola rhizosphaerae]
MIEQRLGEAGLVRARALLDVGRIAAAQQQVRAVLAADPHNVEALLLLARSYQANDDFGPMRDAAAQAVAFAPDQHEGHLLLALAQVGLNHPAMARDSALETVRLAPDDWRGHAAFAIAEFNLGRKRRAFRAIRRAVGLAPETAEPHYIRALMFHSIGWTFWAKPAYRRALALEPEYTAALTGLGRIAVTGARFAVAAEHISAVLAVEPTDHAARTELDRLIIAGLGGWGIMAVWCAGFLAVFAALPWMWLPPLLVPALWVLWAARTWRALSPGARKYAGLLIRTDTRVRVRLAGLALCALTGIGVGITAVYQQPDRPPSAAMLILAGAHLLALFVTVVAGVVTDRNVADRRSVNRLTRTDATQLPPTDLLAEHRESSNGGRWMLRVMRTGAFFAAVPWVMSIDQATPWPIRAVVATIALAAFIGYARWSLRRLIRRPGRPNAVLGMLLVPLALAALAELVVITATAVLPPAAMPLPNIISVAAFVAITAGLLAWLGWLPYATVRGLISLFRRSTL